LISFQFATSLTSCLQAGVDGLIPISIYKGVIDCVVDFFIAKAKKAGLAALGQGFSTYEMEKSTAR